MSAAKKPDDFEIIDRWTEIKHEIISKYAHAYSQIMRRNGFKHAYVDGFSSSGECFSRTQGKFVWGSAVQAALTDPPFAEYHLIDLDEKKLARLVEIMKNVEMSPRQTGDVFIYEGDCNQIITEEIIPLVRYDDYKRGLCLLDPYGLHYHWSTVCALADSKTFEVFFNFPVMDMNRTAIWKNPEKVKLDMIDRMTIFWGDDSWKNTAYYNEPTLFGDVIKKAESHEIVAKYCERLRDVAGFEYVCEPLPMKNSKNSVIYYLIFACHVPVADKIVTDIFDKYRIG